MFATTDGLLFIKEDKNRNIVVNEIGKKLRKAFEWKAQGMKNDEILSRLQALGVKIYKQKLSMILSNPFYCGIIAHKTLNRKLVVTRRNSYPKNYSCVFTLQNNLATVDAKNYKLEEEYFVDKRVPAEIWKSNLACTCMTECY